MRRLFGIVVLAALLLPILARAQRYNLSADDQRRFDSYYTRWLDYKRTNNRDEIISMEKRMQDVYAHSSIPAGTPYARVASPAVRRRDPNRDLPRFSNDDDRRFRSYYARWQEYKRTNNRSEVASMEKRMRDVMNNYNVPPEVSYDEMMNSLNGGGRGRWGRDRNDDHRRYREDDRDHNRYW
jgi:hypothetical protein